MQHAMERDRSPGSSSLSPCPLQAWLLLHGLWPYFPSASSLPSQQAARKPKDTDSPSGSTLLGNLEMLGAWTLCLPEHTLHPRTTPTKNFLSLWPMPASPHGRPPQLMQCAWGLAHHHTSSPCCTQKLLRTQRGPGSGVVGGRLHVPTWLSKWF